MNNPIMDHDLVQALKLTGTGDWYLTPLYEYLGQNPTATVNDGARVLTEHATRDSRFSVTAGKAREIARGRSPMDEYFQGKPPVNKMEESMKRDREELIKAMGKTLGEGMANALGELKMPALNPNAAIAVEPSKRTPAKASA